MLVDHRRQTKRLDFRHMLLLLRLPGFLLLVKVIFSEIKDLADRRLGVRCNTVKIKSHVISLLDSFPSQHRPKLFSFRTDYQNFVKMDILIDQLFRNITFRFNILQALPPVKKAGTEAAPAIINHTIHRHRPRSLRTSGEKRRFCFPFSVTCIQ